MDSAFSAASTAAPPRTARTDARPSTAPPPAAQSERDAPEVRRWPYAIPTRMAALPAQVDPSAHAIGSSAPPLICPAGIHRVLHEGDHAAGHEPRGPHGPPGAC